MKKLITSRAVLGLSLVALFASGIGIGRMTAPGSRQAARPAMRFPANPETWVDAASRALVKDLKLDPAQQQKVQQQLDPVATAIFSDQERALFQMHLRLLELHDTLAATGNLNPVQGTRLAASRAQLRELIIRKFPRLVRGNPSLAIRNDSP